MGPIFIAEASSNHSRELSRALRFVDAAAESGCDAVKFQLFRIDRMFAPEILARSEKHRSRRAWELPIEQWDVMHRVGLRSHYVATWHAAPLMIAQKLGLVVNVSSFGAKIQAVNVAYGVGKAGVDRMTRDMGRELKPYGVTVVSLWVNPNPNAKNLQKLRPYSFQKISPVT